MENEKCVVGVFWERKNLDEWIFKRNSPKEGEEIHVQLFEKYDDDDEIVTRIVIYTLHRVCLNKWKIVHAVTSPWNAAVCRHLFFQKYDYHPSYEMF